MKITPKTALCIFVALAPACALADGPDVTPTAAPYSEQDQFKLVFRLFAPWHQGSQKPLALLRRTVQGRVNNNNENYNAAFNDEVKKFLITQLTDAFVIIGKLQGHQLDATSAESLACAVIEEKLEKPYKAAHNKELFEQDPATLPAAIFTYFTTPYFVEAHKTITLPEINRFDITQVMFYLHSLRIGLNYAGKVLDAVGVPKE